MAVIKNYFRLDANLGYRHLGDLKIYLNKPQISYLLYNDEEYNTFKSALNGVLYIDQSYNEKTDFKGINIYYNWQNGTGSPTSFANGASVTLNPVMPIGTTIGSLVRPNDPEGGYGNTSLYRETSIQSIFYNYAERIFNPVADKDEWNLSLNRVLIVDNIFNRGKPQFTVINPGTSSKYVEIKMTQSRTFDSLATLIASKSEIDTEDINQYIPLDTTSSTYRLTWDEGTDRVFSVKTHIPSYTHSATTDGDYKLTTTSFNGDGSTNSIIFFNDELRFTTHQLSNIRSMSRNVNVLNWTSVSNAKSYSIYVDGNLYDGNVTTNSWTIPDELYYGEFHTYSVSVNSHTTKAYQIMTVSGKSSANASTDTFPMLRRSTFHIYSGTLRQESDEWKNVGQILAPSYRLVKDKLNQYTVYLSHTNNLENFKYYYSNPNGSGTVYEIDGDFKTFSNLYPNVINEYSFFVGTYIDGQLRLGNAVEVSFTPKPYSAPSVQSVTRTDINSFSVRFSSPEKPDRYDVYLNGIIYKANATSPIVVSGWKANQSNTIKIECVYEEDERYNSRITGYYDAKHTPPLITPTLSKKDIKENNVALSFGDAGSKEILDNVTTKVELTWNAIQYASGYILYDNYKVWNNDIQDWEEGLRTFPTQTEESGTEFLSSTTQTIYMDNIQGYHKYSVQAISSIDEAYNSGISSVLELEQNFPLDAPVIEGDNDTTTISFNKVNNADFYSIQLIPTRGTTENLFRSFIPETFPFTYNYYDIVKDLNETDTFIVSVFARSYNAFYFHPSADSNKKSVEVIKLDKPVNLQYDDNTGKLTWTGDSRAYKYRINIKATDGDWAEYLTENTEYTFENLAASLYTLFVTAIRDDSLTNNQPVYLDSDKSDNLSFGLLNIPEDFDRNVNVFSWTSVGADRYVFYEDGKSLTTVDGGGTSLELGMTPKSKYRPTEGVHTYNVQAVTTIDGVEYKSLLSETITETISHLQPPSPRYITEGESYIIWDELYSDVLYDTRINNISEKDLTNENVYSIKKDEAGVYKFKVRTITIRNDKERIDEFTRQTSEFSEELNYYVFKLSRPEISLNIKEDPQTGFDEYTFTWENITNATSYTVIENHDGEEIPHLVNIEFITDKDGNIKVKEGFIPSFKFFPESGNYTVRVYANGSTALYPNPKYITSDSSNIIKFGKLEAPHIEINENVISWEKNELADFYEIYNYGEYFSQTDDTSFVLDVSKPYSYSITVKAISNDKLIMPSDYSNSEEYVITQLRSPKNLRLNGDYLTWDLVLNADGYRIYINDELTIITSTTQFNLKNIFSSRAGILNIYITAYSNAINLLPSEPSNILKKRIEKEKKYNIVIENENYDKIQLPFTMNFTLDETLDSAAITLAYIDRKEPFEKHTPADIIIYESAGTSRKFPMVVASDEVVEVQIGTEIKYKHYLQLLEKTILLQNEIIADFAVSSSVKDLLKKLDEVISPDIGNNSIYKRAELIDVGTFDSIDLADGALITILYTIADLLNLEIAEDLKDIKDSVNLVIPTGVAFITGINKNGEVDAIIPKNLSIGETFVIPNPANRLSCFAISIKSVLNNVLELFGLGDWEDFGGLAGTQLIVKIGKIILGSIKKIAKIAGKLAWVIAIIIFLIEYLIYIIKILLGKRGYTWAGLLEKLLTTDLGAIGDIFYTDNDWAYPARKYYIRPTNPSYEKTDDEELIADIQASIGNKVETYSFKKAGVYDLIMEVPAVDYQKLFENDLIDFDTSILSGSLNAQLPRNVNFMKDENGNPTKYRVVWHGINVSKDSVEVNYFKISEVLQKIEALTNYKYTIDPKIIEYTNTLICPDMTFSNGNYLYDVLETIGREFNGIPRLLEDNIITYDILNVNTANDKNMSFWQDKPVISNISQDLDKTASGFISRVSNMVPDEDFTIYPAPDMWISPRADATDIAALYVESLAVTVDKPIYKINKVYVKNVVKEMKEFVLDITDYVYQDVVYNSLNNNAKGKGMALVWKQGDKSIRGLGQLPEASKFYAFLGWNAEIYVIENIVKDYLTTHVEKNWLEHYNTLPPGDYLFNIEYQGYTNTTVFLENPDKKNIKYAMYSVFNQEDNTISDTRFGNGALNILKRHNTNIVKREYQSYSIVALPLIGSMMTINDSPFYVDELSYEFNNSYIKASCNFSKNYNKISPRTAINSEYRQYELRSDNEVDRVINFNEYCILGNLETSLDGITIKNNWVGAIRNSLNGKQYNKPECFYINCYNSLNLDKIRYETVEVVDKTEDGKVIYEIKPKDIEGIALPISYNRIGTSVNFSAGMADPFTAGYSTRRENNNDDNLERVQSYVRYVGDNSMDQTPYMRLSIVSLPNSVKNYKTVEKVGNNNIEVSVAETFPSVPWFSQPTVSLTRPYFSKLFKVYKDQRETLKFNYQMHFMSNRDDLFIHKGFTKYLFKSSNFTTKDEKPILVGYTTDITQKDIFDTSVYKLSDVYVDDKKIYFDKINSNKDFKGLAVIWPSTKEILLEIRTSVSKNEEIELPFIYFNFSDKIKR